MNKFLVRIDLSIDNVSIEGRPIDAEYLQKHFERLLRRDSTFVSFNETSGCKITIEELKDTPCLPPFFMPKLTDPYTGPFPRKRHGHRCLYCGGNPVTCYKKQCTLASRIQNCQWCSTPRFIPHKSFHPVDFPDYFK